MSKMNTGRIVAGGLLAGLVMNIYDAVLEPFFGDSFAAWLESLGRPAPGEGAMIALAGLGFVFGILIVWLYAAIRPRFGAGPRTALIAGIVVWALTCLLPNAFLLGLGLFSSQLFVLWSLIGVPEALLATFAGAWVYREADTQRVRAYEPMTATAR